MGVRDNNDSPVNTGAASPPVNALVALVDSGSLAVVWANDAVYAAVAERGGSPEQVAILDEAIPMATAVGLSALVREVGFTGVPAHRTANIVSTARGSATLVLSVYRIPDGQILVIAENSWSAEIRSPRGADRDRPRRRR